MGAILTLCIPRVGAKMLGIAAIASILFTSYGHWDVSWAGALLLVIATVLAFIADAQIKAGSAYGVPRQSILPGVQASGRRERVEETPESQGH